MLVPRLAADRRACERPGQLLSLAASRDGLASGWENVRHHITGASPGPSLEAWRDVRTCVARTWRNRGRSGALATAASAEVAAMTQYSRIDDGRNRNSWKPDRRRYRPKRPVQYLKSPVENCRRQWLSAEPRALVTCRNVT